MEDRRLIFTDSRTLGDGSVAHRFAIEALSFHDDLPNIEFNVFPPGDIVMRWSGRTPQSLERRLFRAHDFMDGFRPPGHSHDSNSIQAALRWSGIECIGALREDAIGPIRHAVTAAVAEVFDEDFARQIFSYSPLNEIFQ